jgi:fructose-1,6-bisphosphatase/inositol monophosphatase family enzyme
MNFAGTHLSTALPDIELVSRIIRDTAVKEIMPRFENLATGDITEKRPGDLVTAADIAAEQRLERELVALVPGSAVVGEEAAEANPDILGVLAGDAPVWVIDPVDGTYNFAHAKPCFAVIIAYCLGGRTVAGWIHDPVADITTWAVEGQGAWIGKHRLTVAPPASLESMSGSLGYPPGASSPGTMPPAFSFTARPAATALSSAPARGTAPPIPTS